jgi:opacity protein-like surface antigen
MKIITIILFSCILCFNRSAAQFISSPWQVGVNVGSLVYQGDLSESRWGNLHDLKPALGVQVSRTLDDFFTLRANLVLGTIGANDAIYSSPAYRKYRGFRFSSSITELSVGAEYWLFGDASGSRVGQFSPYLFAGVGLSKVNIKRYWSSMDVAYFGAQSSAVVGLGKDTLHQLPGIIPVLPIGGGVRYGLAQHWSLRAEIMYRLTGTDYLDGFKYAANPNTNDHYYSFTLGLTYQFGHNRLDCPKVPQ